MLEKLGPEAKLTTRLTEINGAPGVIIHHDDKPNLVLSLDYTIEGISAINIVLNPEKLRSIASVSPQ